MLGMLKTLLSLHPSILWESWLGCILNDHLKTQNTQRLKQKKDLKNAVPGPPGGIGANTHWGEKQITN